MAIVMDGSTVVHRRFAITRSRALHEARLWAAPRESVVGHWVNRSDLPNAYL